MNISNFDFDLPEDLIGHEPIEPRDSCKLLILDKASGSITHYVFSDLVELLDKNTVLVINDTKVFPARLFGKKETGGRTELLLIKQLSSSTFTALGKGKLLPDQTIVFDSGLACRIEHKDGVGMLTLKFNLDDLALLRKIDEIGVTPLPGYIHSLTPEKELRQKYQTVYAKEQGSAAAPTAGMHFTPELLEKLKEKGIAVEKVTLHIGLGTFRPVTDEQIATKTLHTESFRISVETATGLNEAKRQGKKIIAVGTTTCRVLETRADSDGIISAGEGETNIFIRPEYKFNFVDGLITNFHLPKTSLLMLVSALVSHPNSPTVFKDFRDSPVGKAYREAVEKKYKFFSFGDAMLIL